MWARRCPYTSSCASQVHAPCTSCRTRIVAAPDSSSIFMGVRPLSCRTCCYEPVEGIPLFELPVLLLLEHTCRSRHCWWFNKCWSGSDYARTTNSGTGGR